MSKKKVLALCVTTAMLLSATPLFADAAEPEKIQVIVGFHGPPDTHLIASYGGHIETSMHQINAVVAIIPETAFYALQNTPRVRYVEEDKHVQLIQAQQLPWGIDRIDADLVWPGSNSGAGVTIAICDTGIDYDHPDLAANCIWGKSFVDYTTDWMDDEGHGTHCAGIAAAINNDIGVVGVAPDANLMPVKVLDYNGGADFSWVAQGIIWAADNGADVISLSIGYRSHVQSWQDACDYAYYDKGCVVVAAAGNSGNPGGNNDCVDYPARYDSTIAVAATTQSDSRASFSSTGPDVELAAPGYEIYSTLWDDTYDYMSGTSMACPHVAGVAALVIASGITNNVDVRNQMAATAEDLGAAGRDIRYGYGLVDAEKAAGGGTNIPPTCTLTADPSAGEAPLATTFYMSASDSDGSMAFWELDVNNDGTAEYSGSGDPPATQEHTYNDVGDYTAKLTVTDNEGATGSETTTVSVSGPNTPPDAPTNPSPADGATGVSTSPTLSVHVTDPDGDSLTVSFYNAADNSLIGTDTGVASSSTASVTWSGLSYSTTYSWYAVADDGLDTTTSATWSFTTEQEPQGGGMYVWDISWSAAGPHLKSQVTIKVDSDGDGVAESGDSVVSGATVYYTLTNQDTGDSQSFTGTTDSNGQIGFMWKRAPTGPYKGLVTNVEHSSYTYDAILDVDNPDYYTH